MNLNIFVIYYELLIPQKLFLKSFIKAVDSGSAKSIFTKKLKRDLPNKVCRNIKLFKIKQKKYRNRLISDKHWDQIMNFSYPNGKHRLYKFEKDAWFKTTYPNRNINGTYKSGHIPWNKGLKIQFIHQDSSGKFLKPRNKIGEFKSGIKPVIIGNYSCNLI